MVKIISRFFAFCGEENRRRFHKSILLGVLQAIFEALKIPAIACMVRALLRGNVTTQDILLALGIMLFSILGSSLVKSRSIMLQTEGGYDTCARKRVEIAEHMRYLPMRSPSICVICRWDISMRSLWGRSLRSPQM